MLGLAGVPSLIQLIGFLFLPESPRYIMMKKGDEGRARQILQNVRGTSDVEQELEEIRETCRLEEEASRNGKLYIYKSKHMNGWKECQFNSTYRT